MLFLSYFNVLVSFLCYSVTNIIHKAEFTKTMSFTGLFILTIAITLTVLLESQLSLGPAVGEKVK